MKKYSWKSANVANLIRGENDFITLKIYFEGDYIEDMS